MRLILPLPGHEAFADRLARAGGWTAIAPEARRFPDGESYLRLPEEVRGRPVDLVCSLARPDPQFLPLAFAADAARELGAGEVTLIAPYLAYLRQDTRFRPGEAVSSRSFARLLSACVDRVLTVDPHLHRYPALSRIYRVPTATLHAAPLLARWIAANVRLPLIVGPDEESAQWAAAIAAAAGAPHVVARKQRRGDREVEVTLPDLSAWRDHQPVLVDDIASSGRTLIAVARQVQRQGLPRPDCVVVHGLFADDAFAALQPFVRQIVSTDSVAHPSNRIGLAPLFAEALAQGLRDPAGPLPGDAP
jgi:ribose-phosphate pyrophosphokinase